MNPAACAADTPCTTLPNAGDHAVPNHANSFQLLVGADAFVR